MKEVISLVGEIVKRRKLIWDLSKADFRKRFVGSYFGVVWMFVQPVVTVLIYFCIFQLGFKSVPPVPGGPYVAVAGKPGTCPGFSARASIRWMAVRRSGSYLVKKVVFQVEVLPVIKLLSSLMVHGFFVIIMIVMALCYGRAPMITWIQVIYYTLSAHAGALGSTFYLRGKRF